MSITVRFPPSPTGKMHIGNARTALFNWLFARHGGGTFNVRIEDTDRERSTPENIAFIYEALEWLGLDYDNRPFLQTTRVAEHMAAAAKLKEQGLAYVDEEGVTRVKVPAGETSWDDLVQGPITINNGQVEDFALLRSDGSPTYHVGVVCDDAFMGVTHVIRGADHIANTPKHMLLFKALGYAVPQFGHLPLITGEGGQKLSKRHGAASVQDLRELGYLPQAVLNYMARLGWGHGDQELFSRDELIKLFDIRHVSQSPAQYDLAKLAWVNAQYLKTLPMEQVMPHLLPFLAAAEPLGQELTAQQLARLQALWPGLTQRATTLVELAAAAVPVLGTQPAVPAEHTDEWVAAKPLLANLHAALQSQTDWSREALDATIKQVVKDSGQPFKLMGHGLRLALIGQTQGPGLAALLNAFGREESLARLA